MHLTVPSIWVGILRLGCDHHTEPAVQSACRSHAREGGSRSGGPRARRSPDAKRNAGLRPRTTAVLLLAALLLAGPASATIWPVSTTAQLGTALSSAGPGDVIRLADGSYSGDLRPGKSGTSGARIAILGNLSNPAAVSVSGSLDLKDRNFVTVAGIHFVRDIGMWGFAGVAAHDSVWACVADGSLSMEGSQDCHVAQCHIGDGVGEDGWNVTDYYGTRATDCTWRDNVFNLRKTVQPHAVHFDKLTGGGGSRNRIFITIPAGTSDVYGRITYGLDHTTWSDDRTTLLNLTGRPNYAFAQRDYCVFNTYVRDTVDEAPGSTGPLYIRFATSGSFPGSCGNNTFIDCYFKSSGNIDYQNNTVGDLHQGGTYIAGGLAMDFSPLVDFCDTPTFRHCTFRSASGVCADFRKTFRATLLENIYSSATSNCPGVFLPASFYRNDSSLYFQDGGMATNSVGSTAAGGCTAPPAGSRWGRPAFLNSSYAAFDSRVSGGASVDPSWPDGYVGAHTGSSQGPLVATPDRPCVRLVGTLRGVADTSGLYRVTVTDASGRPVGAAQVSLDFSGAPDVRVGASQPFGGMTVDGAARTVSAFTNLAGVATFDIVGGGRANAVCSPGVVPIRANGSVLAKTQVTAVDLDGVGGVSLLDIGLWIGDFYGSGYCARTDLNGDGKVTLADYALLAGVYYRSGSYFSAASYAW